MQNGSAVVKAGKSSITTGERSSDRAAAAGSLAGKAAQRDNTNWHESSGSSSIDPSPMSTHTIAATPGAQDGTGSVHRSTSKGGGGKAGRSARVPRRSSSSKSTVQTRSSASVDNGSGGVAASAAAAAGGADAAAAAAKPAGKAATAAASGDADAVAPATAAGDLPAPAAAEAATLPRVLSPAPEPIGGTIQYNLQVCVVACLLPCSFEQNKHRSSWCLNHHALCGAMQSNCRLALLG